MEFACVLPVLMLLIIGIIEFGRAMMVKQVLTNGAREAARAAVLAGSSDTEVNQILAGYFGNANIAGYSTQITPSVASATSGTPITVSVTVPYSSISWMPAGSMAGLDGVILSASVVMRKE